jgi:hypothetical protein
MDFQYLGDVNFNLRGVCEIPPKSRQTEKALGMKSSAMYLANSFL